MIGALPLAGFCLLLPLAGHQDQAPVGAFPAYLWRLDHREQPLPDDLLECVGGSHVERDASAAWLIERGAPFYVGHGPGRNTLHLDRTNVSVVANRSRFAATRVAASLERSPCLSDPATRVALIEQLTRSLAPDDRRSADFVSLGDEVSITPWGDPLDFCHSPHCEAAFQVWAAGEGGRRYGLREGTVRPSTDALLSSPTDDRLAAWLAARAFQRQVLSQVLLDLAASARAQRPGLPVALLGLIGETPYGGVDLEALGPAVPVLEPYPVADAVERCATLRALGAGPTTILETLFLKDHDPTSLTAHLEGLIESPVDGVVVWCDRDLAAHPLLAEPLRDGLENLRRARAAAQDVDRDPIGVAVLHSDDSLAHAFLREARNDRLGWTARLAGYQQRHGNYSVRLGDLFAELRGQGERPGAVSIERVGPDLLPRFAKLFALDLTVISDGELEDLRAYIAAGGQVLVRGPFAEFRPNGTRRSEDTQVLLQH